MKKDELVELLKSLNIPVNEGLSAKENKDAEARIVFWDYAWEDIISSGEMYEVKETYQVSFYSTKPRHEKLLELRKLLRTKKIYPLISHEFVEKDRIFHSFFAVEVID